MRFRFKYVGKFESMLKTNLEHESADQVDTFYEKTFHIFHYNFAFWPRILILFRLAESSEHSEFESI